MKRFQESLILKDLEKKMVFLVGPRQAGKTYLAKTIGNHFQNVLYLNYDLEEHRKTIQKKSWLPQTELLIFDELHKMRGWKNYLKGVFDTKPHNLRILVTGSARMDTFHTAGDSLAGRYFLHHLFPLSIAELNHLGEPLDLEKLIERSGFPEPYLAEDMISVERWRMQYINSLITMDVLNFENISNLKAMNTIFQLLRKRVGSPISYSAIAQDVGISPATVKKYIQVLEALYIIFRVTPYSKKIARSLLKEPKIYFFDTGLVDGDEGIKFENLLAISLYKHTQIRRDYLAEDASLHYMRTKEKREVDFALCVKEEVLKLIEAKNQDHDLSPSLKWFQKLYQHPAYQIVKHLDHPYQIESCVVENGLNFLRELENLENHTRAKGNTTDLPLMPV
jgi:predicted AAA+ superfamily ATPase